MPSRIGKTPIVDYLRKAYADDLAKVNNCSTKMSSLESETTNSHFQINGATLKILKRGNIKKEETLELFATPFVKDLFDL